MISVYSVSSAVIFYNLCLTLVFLLRRKTSFLLRYTSSALAFLTVLGCARLFTPVDFRFACVIRSSVLLPAVQSAAAEKFWGISAGAWLLIFWGCGTRGFAARDIAREAGAYRARAAYRYVRNAQAEEIAAGFGRGYTVKTSPDISFPYTAGIFRPVIYLPAAELTRDELRFILRHETQHIRSCDALKKLLFLAVEALFWWNPLAHISLDEIDALLELQCDAKVTAGLDRQGVLEYMHTMISVLKHACGANEPESLCSAKLLNEPENVRQRFEVLLGQNEHRSGRARFMLCGVFLAAFLLSYGFIIQPGGFPPEEDLEGVVEITPENSYILYEDGKYYLYFEDSFFMKVAEDEIRSEPYKNLEIREVD